MLLRTIPRIERERTTILAVGAVLLLAASGRLLSLMTVGLPHATFVALMVVEFVVPVILIPWQAVVARRWAQERHERPGHGTS